MDRLKNLWSLNNHASVWENHLKRKMKWGAVSERFTTLPFLSSHLQHFSFYTFSPKIHYHVLYHLCVCVWCVHSTYFHINTDVQNIVRSYIEVSTETCRVHYFILLSAYLLAIFSICISEYIYSHCPVSRTHVSSRSHKHTLCPMVPSIHPSCAAAPILCENIYLTCIHVPFKDILSAALKDHSNDLALCTV